MYLYISVCKFINLLIHTHTHTVIYIHIYMYIYIYIYYFLEYIACLYIGGALGIIVIIIGNGYSDASSNP